MLTNTQREKLRRLYVDERLSCARIAEQLGVNDKTVQRWLVEAGVTLRSRSEAASLQWGARDKILKEDEGT